VFWAHLTATGLSLFQNVA